MHVMRPGPRPLRTHAPLREPTGAARHEHPPRLRQRGIPRHRAIPRASGPRDPHRARGDAQRRTPDGALARTVSTLAAPVLRYYRWLGSSPPSVYVQALILSASGIAALWTGTYRGAATGILLVGAGHLLVTAARALDAGPLRAWGAFLDTVVCRGVDAALLVAVARLAFVPPSAPPWLPGPVQVVPATLLPALAGAAVAALLGWHLVRTVGDLHLLRASLLRTRRVPGPAVLTPAPALPAWMLPRRDRILLLATLLLLAAQPQLLLAATALLPLVATAAYVLAYRARLAHPEPQATRLMAPDYR